MGGMSNQGAEALRRGPWEPLIRRCAPPSPHRMGRRNFSVGQLPGVAAWRPYPGLLSGTPLGEWRLHSTQNFAREFLASSGVRRGLKDQATRDLLHFLEQ